MIEKKTKNDWNETELIETKVLNQNFYNFQVWKKITFLWLTWLHESLSTNSISSWTSILTGDINGAKAS